MQMRTKLQNPTVCGPLGMSNLPYIRSERNGNRDSALPPTSNNRFFYIGKHASASPIPADLGIGLRLFTDILKPHLFFSTFFYEGETAPHSHILILYTV